MDLAKESSVQEVKTVTDEIKSLIGSEISAQLSALKAELISAMSSNASGCVKHIQRGYSHFSSTSKSTTIKLSGFTNLGKMVAIVNGGDTEYSYNAYVSELTATSLVVLTNEHGSTDSAYFSYQVIEFY